MADKKLWRARKGREGENDDTGQCHISYVTEDVTALKKKTPSTQAVATAAVGSGQADVVANDFGIARRVEKTVGASWHSQCAIAEHHVTGRVDLDDLVVELVRDEEIAVLGRDRVRWLRIGGAAGPRGRHVGEHIAAGLVDDKNAVVQRIGNQGVAVAGQTAGVGRTVEDIRVARITVLPDQIGFAVHFDNSVVAGVGDEIMAVAEPLGAGGRAKLVAAAAAVSGAVLPDNVPFVINLDNTVIALIGDQHV